MNFLEKYFGPKEAVAPVDFSGLLNVNNIESIHITASKKWFSNEFRFYSDITFTKDGETLKKEFNGTSLNEVYRKVYDFCSQIQKM